MAKNIIVLKQKNDNGYIEVQYLFWLAVPVAMQTFFADDTKKSIWLGAITADNTALQNGSVLEILGTSSYTLGTSTAVIGADLLNKFNSSQTLLNNNNNYHFYGTYYDSVTGWTVQGVN